MNTTTINYKTEIQTYQLIDYDLKLNARMLMFFSYNAFFGSFRFTLVNGNCADTSDSIHFFLPQFSDINVSHDANMYIYATD